MVVSGTLRLSASILILLLSGCGDRDRSGGLSGAAKGMNVVLVVVDTLRTDHLSAYGYHRETGPNLTRLAGRGVRFDRAQVPCNFSGGSYASIFTGLYPHHHSVREHPMVLAESLDTLADRFRAEGYRTFGRHAHGLLRDRWNYRQGFDSYVHAGDGETSTSEVLSFLSEVGDDPFFVFLQLMEPHYPYRPDPGFGSEFIEERPGFEGRLKRIVKTKTHLMFGYQQLGFEPEDTAHLISLYDGEIQHCDALIGSLDKSLEKHGLSDNTLLVIVSDHGEALGSHGVIFNHDATLYEEILSVPLVFSNPVLFSSPRVVDAVVESIDVFPTLMDLLGFEIPFCDGSSLVELLEGVAAPRERLAFAEGRPLDISRRRIREEAVRQGLADPIPHYRVFLEGIEGKWRSVRSGTHKLILIPDTPKPHWELYDLALDPDELTNLYGTAETLDTQHFLQWALMKWMRNDERSGGKSVLDRKTFEELKALGYVEGEFEEYR